jgi:lycopene cyclase domain-containing protein
VTYTQLGILGVALAIGLDLWVVRTRLVRRRVFWKAYAIIIFFQLLTNGVLTGLRIVRYNGEKIVGSDTPLDSAPPFLGDGRIAFAPGEDLLFGFSLVLLTLVLWVWLGRSGVGQSPMAGPPHPIIRRFMKL